MLLDTFTRIRSVPGGGVLYGLVWVGDLLTFYQYVAQRNNAVTPPHKMESQIIEIVGLLTRLQLT